MPPGVPTRYPLSRSLARKKKTDNAEDSKSRSLSEIVDEYGLNDDLWRVTVPSTSPIAGLTLGNLALRKNYDLDVLELRTGEHSRRLIKDITQEAPTANPGDVLFVRGPKGGRLVRHPLRPRT